MNGSRHPQHRNKYTVFRIPTHRLGFLASSYRQVYNPALQRKPPRLLGTGNIYQGIHILYSLSFRASLSAVRAEFIVGPLEDNFSQRPMFWFTCPHQANRSPSLLAGQYLQGG